MARSPGTQSLTTTHDYQCMVTGIQPTTGAANKGETADPVVYLYLTETKGRLVTHKCYLPEVARNEMLAVAIAAISTAFPVTATLAHLQTLATQTGKADACVALRLTAG